MAPSIWGGGNYLYVGKRARLTVEGTCRLAKGIRLKLFENAELSIGDAFTSNANMIISCMNSVIIGNDCLVGWEVTILDNDGGHSISNVDSGIISNETKPVIIGNHCWLSSYVTLLKGSTLSDNCAVGYGTTVVGKSFHTKNCIVAGNPPKVIKENINWSH